ncbi:MAG: HD domain-containing protein [Patescibacteria group bacterium]
MRDAYTEAVLALGQLALQFGRVNRITRHEDGVTPESDTDHTVMMGLVACSYASSFAPHLDLGKVSQFALVHDLVEAYAGDTASIGGKLSQEKRSLKEHKEREALERLEKEFSGSFPWLIDMIKQYEALSCPEARFIKAIDKVMPKITNILSGCVVVKQEVSVEEFEERLTKQRIDMYSTYAKDQPEAMDLFDSLTAKMLHLMKQ